MQVLSALKKVLVVEDDSIWAGYIRRNLESKVLVEVASTIEKAEEIFAKHPDITIVVMDACVQGDTPNTLPLVQKMRKTFTGPIIAISSDSAYRKELLAAGCDHECTKDMVPKKVLELVGVS